MSTESLEEVSNGQRSITYMGRTLEVPQPEHWREHVEQRIREIEEIDDRCVEGLATERREAIARAMHHMQLPYEVNDNVLSRWSFEGEHHSDLSIDPATGEIINSGNVLPDENTIFNLGSRINTSENNGLIAANTESSYKISVNDVITDKYNEMEKRVEEQDKTIAEMKSIIENLQDIVYKRKLDKEAENLVL